MKIVCAFFIILFISLLYVYDVKDVAAQEADAPIIVLGADAAKLKTNAQLKVEKYDEGSNIGFWTSTTDEIHWDMVVRQAGEYEVTVQIACDPQCSGSTVHVTVDKQTLSFTVPDTGAWWVYKDVKIGCLSLKAGTYTVMMKANKIINHSAGNILSLIFDSRSIKTVRAGTSEQRKEHAASVLENRFIWMMYDAICNRKDVSNALSYNAEVLIRGWFKWGRVENWKPPAYFIRYVQAKNILFGAGGTLSAIYPDEVDEETLERLVDRNPYNKPEHFQHNPANNYYHGNVQNKEYLDFILTWVFDHIDAGVDTLFMDEVGGGGSWYIGYSDASTAAFTGYLIEKYVEGLGWNENDTRWKKELDIDLRKDCTDHTIKTFDYRKYLIRKGYQDAPYRYEFPLKKEWGNPWDYMLTESYINRRNQEAWKYVMDSIWDYCAKKGRYVLIAANGLNEYVDYQIEGVWDRWKVDNGKLDMTPSYIEIWREKLAESKTLLGVEVPVLIFHDWGATMPFFDEIKDDDRILWLRVYTPEVFASGAIFIWPVLNCGIRYRPSQALDKVIRNLMTWYGNNRGLYKDARWVGSSIVDMKGIDHTVNAVSDIQTLGESRRIVHLINKKLGNDRKLVTRSNFAITVPSMKKPASVFAVSPDFSGEKSLTYAWENGSVDITVNRLDAYTVVILNYK